MSYVAWPNQTPIGTTSNFLQCKWVSCSKSYWQGYDLGWYKGMGAPCFPQPNLWLARCASMLWTALKKFDVLFTQRLRVGIKPFIPLRAESVAGFVGAPSAPSVPSVPYCAVLRRLGAVLRCLAVCTVLRDGARWCRWWAQRNNRAMRPQCFIPTSQKHSLSLLVSPARTSRPAPNKATETVIFFFGKMFAPAAAAAWGSSSGSSKQQAASSRQAATSVCPLERIIKYKF